MGATCKQAIWGTLVAGQKKEGELATTSLEFEFYHQFPRGSPSTGHSCDLMYMYIK